MKDNNRSPRRVLRIAGAIVLLVIVYGYGFQVTKVDFSETRSERRLASFSRVLRALAHPNLFEYEYQETDVDSDFYLPCPEGEVDLPQPDRSNAYILTDVACADPKDSVLIEGYNFQPNSRGPINFITASGVKLQLGSFKADAYGHFEVEVQLPVRQPVTEAQTIRATGRIRVGSPAIHSDARVTWDKIVETVFLALLATTVGTFISIPISFLAARNLMSDVKSPLTSMALSILGWPLGIWLGVKATLITRQFITAYVSGLVPTAIGIVLSVVLIYLIFKWSVLIQKEQTTGSAAIGAQIFSSLAIIFFGLSTVILLGELFIELGPVIADTLGPFSFLGNFVYQWGDILVMFSPTLAALIGAGLVGGLFGKLGHQIRDRYSSKVIKGINMVFAPLAVAVTLVILGQIINWFYQINDPMRVIWLPAGVGGAVGLALAIWASPKQALPTGIVTYAIARTALNVTRSIEPLIMALVFVTWVGLGPFAGALALGLHTVAALSKLYSEQVESILPGPLEAVQATGSNRLQTIIYAVVPQIVPPYISFTMYRWDINVRMSTIIGFVGGGGIGFVLKQNIDLLNYRAASVNMLAIAIVVATMDYISSAMRERFV